MNGQITISLQDYKELERDRAIVNELNSNNKKFICHYSSYGAYIVSIGNEASVKLVNDLKNAIESRDHIIEKLKRLENRKVSFWDWFWSCPINFFK